MLTPELIRRSLEPLELTVMHLIAQGVWDPEEQLRALAAAAHTTTLTDGNWNGEPSIGVRVHRREMTGGNPEQRVPGGGFGSEKSGPMVEGERRLPTLEELVEARKRAKRKLQLLARRNGHEPEREKQPPEPVHRPLTSPPLRDARNRVKARRKRQGQLKATGKPVIIPETLPTVSEKEETMTDTPDVRQAPAGTDAIQEGFADRVAREAEEESAGVLADLVKLRWRADQVERVLRALGKPVPPHLQALCVGGVLEAPEQDLRFQERQEAAEPPFPANVGVDTGEPVEAPQEPPEPPAEDPEQPAVAPQPPQVPGPPPEEQTLTEGVPEELRRMPAAQARRWSAQQEEAARLQLRILGVCEDGRDTFTAPEIATALKLDRGKVGKHLRELEGAGLIRRTGKNRLSAGQKEGRSGVEYAPLRQQVPAETAKNIEAAAAHEGIRLKGPLEVAPDDRVAAQAEMDCSPMQLAQVRDFAQGRKDTEFTVPETMRVTGLPELCVRAALSLLIQRHSVEYVGMNDVDEDVYRFMKPEPDNAPRPRHRTPEEEAGSNGHAKGMPVPGTGRKLVGAGPHAQAVNALLDDLRAAGVKVEMGDNSHFVVKHGHSRMQFAQSPGTHRSVLDTRTRLKNAGVLPRS